MIDDAFKEKDPVRHCAMRGMSGKVINTSSKLPNDSYLYGFVKFQIISFLQFWDIGQQFCPAMIY